MSPESEYLPPAPAAPFFYGSSLVDDSGLTELSPRLRADLLDLEAWDEILTT